MYEEGIYQATLADRHYGPHSEFLVSIQGESIGRYSRTAYATNLLAVPGTSYGDRPYQINVDNIEFD